VKKISLLAVGAIGYVLGTRAGRERYEQIKRQAQKAWNAPPVQGAVDDVEEVVRHTASDVGSKVAEAAGEARAKVTEKIKHDGESHAAPRAADYVPPESPTGVDPDNTGLA
jgi:hypothetical protein